MKPQMTQIKKSQAIETGASVIPGPAAPEPGISIV